MTEQNGSSSGGTGAQQQLLPRHRYMLQKVDAAFGIYDELSTESMFLQSGVIDKVRKLHVCGSIVYCTQQQRTSLLHHPLLGELTRYRIGRIERKMPLKSIIYSYSPAPRLPQNNKGRLSSDFRYFACHDGSVVREGALQEDIITLAATLQSQAHIGHAHAAVLLQTCMLCTA